VCQGLQAELLWGQWVHLLLLSALQPAVMWLEALTLRCKQHTKLAR